MSQPKIQDDMDPNICESQESSEPSMKLILSESVCNEAEEPVPESESILGGSASKRALSPPPPSSESPGDSSKKMKLAEDSEDDKSRRESIAVIKVIQNKAETSLIDLISDKEESTTNPLDDTREDEGKDLSQDLFQEESMPEENEGIVEKNVGATKSSCSPKKDTHSTPAASNEKQKKSSLTPREHFGQTSSSIEFNEKDALSSTPHVPSVTLPLPRLESSEKETAELPKEGVFFVQLSDITLLKGIRNRGFEFGPIYRAPHIPEPLMLEEMLGWEKVELKDFGSKSGGRLSDASSLSTLSSKVSSIGYMADRSSGGSGLSDLGKRDRASIAPETCIASHKVVAKLPEFKTTPKHILEDLTSVPSKRKVLRKKKPKKEESVSISETVDTEEKQNEESSHIQIGQDVFAKWPEGRRKANYYFGTVLDKMSAEDGKCKIKFCDGIEKVLKELDVVTLDTLVPGSSVNVEVEDKCTRSAIILSHPIPSKEGLSYFVEYEVEGEEPHGESILAPLSKIFLEEEQVSAITSDKAGVPKGESPSLTGGDLSLNNIVSTKRTRSTRLLITPSKITKKGGKFLDTSATETSCSETPKSTASSRKKANKSVVGPSTTETENEESSSSSSRKKGFRSKTNFNEGALFNDMCFILTKTLNKGQIFGIDAETTDPEDSSSSSSDENDNAPKEEEEGACVFSKSEIKSLVLKHGGTVLPSFPGQKSKFPPKEQSFYVLSDKGCRTLNFLYGIIHGITRISYQWVLDSVRSRKKFPTANYLLPIGYSEILGTEIEQRNVESKPLSFLLHKVKVLVLGESGEDWKSVLVRLGAKAVYQEQDKKSFLNESSLKDIDVVLVTDDNQEKALSTSLPVVSPRWIIQSIINGKKLGFDFFLIK